MRRASQAVATVGLLLSLAAISLMARDGLFRIEGLWGVLIASIPVGASALSLRAALADRPGHLWVATGVLASFLVIAAFSVGPYFWASAGLASIAAVLLQVSPRRSDTGTHPDLG